MKNNNFNVLIHRKKNSVINLCHYYYMLPFKKKQKSIVA